MKPETIRETLTATRNALDAGDESTAAETASRLAGECCEAMIERTAEVAASRAGIIRRLVEPWGGATSHAEEIGRIALDTAATRAHREIVNLIGSLRVDGQIPAFNVSALLVLAEEALTLLPAPVPARAQLDAA